MKSMKKFIGIALILLICLSIAVPVLAYSSYKTPLEIISTLTSMSQDDIINEKAKKTFARIAKENNVLDEFKRQMLESKKQIINERIKAGSITDEEGEQILNNVKERQQYCNGEGYKKWQRQSNGYGRGNGYGKGMGRGICFR